MAVRVPLAGDVARIFDACWAPRSGGVDLFLRQILDSGVEWFDASAISLFTRNESGEFVLAAQSGPRSRVPDHTVLLAGEGIAGGAITSGVPHLVQDLVGSGRYTSAMVVPLCTLEGDCLGVMNVARTDAKPKYGKADLQAADHIARFIALAVNNANLVSRLESAAAISAKQSEELDVIIASLGVGVLVVNSYEEVTIFNPEATVLLGTALQTGALMPAVIKHLPTEFRSSLLTTMGRALDGKRASSRGANAETDQTWSVTASPLRNEGCVIAIQDITAYEQAQHELARVKRLAEIGQMTAAIAHEIRNPLTGIRSAAQMIQSLGGESAEFGTIIEEEALKLNSLCDQFLDFARPLELNKKSIEVGAVVRRVAEMHQADFEAKEVRLNLLFGEALPTISADPLRLEQVVRNLMLNALQACSAGDEVIIDLRANGLRILDEGSGIRPEMLGKLFTPFFTTKPSGTGLGLPTVRKITDAHGWTIHVQSQVGEGTQFELTWDQAA